MPIYYHVADALHGIGILKDGLQPASWFQAKYGFTPHHSDYTDPDYVYVFGSLGSAMAFAKAMKAGSQFPMWILKVTSSVKFKEDVSPGMESFSALKYRGSIPAAAIKKFKVI